MIKNMEKNINLRERKERKNPTLPRGGESYVENATLKLTLPNCMVTSMLAFSKYKITIIIPMMRRIPIAIPMPIYRPCVKSPIVKKRGEENKKFSLKLIRENI
jgi:hypothetical protein